MAVLFGSVKQLAPRHQRPLCMCKQLKGQHKVMTAQVLNLEQLISNNACEAALVRVIGSIRPVHREQPATARDKFERVNRVGKAR